MCACVYGMNCHRVGVLCVRIVTWTLQLLPSLPPPRQTPKSPPDRALAGAAGGDILGCLADRRERGSDDDNDDDGRANGWMDSQMRLHHSRRGGWWGINRRGIRVSSGESSVVAIEKSIDSDDQSESAL